MVGAKDLVLITVSHNVSFTGKTWLLLMLCFRSLVVLLAGFSLFGDEQERFVCNTIQPGCSNLCFNVFCPVSILRLWLFHLLLLLLPHLVFCSYLAHSVLSEPAPPPPRTLDAAPPSFHKVKEWAAPRFHCAYVCVVVSRTVLEAAFGVGQFFLFGLSFPKSFLCYEAPCTSGIECYVSRPTEKSLMLNFMLALAALSILLSFLDLVGALKAMVRWRKRQESLTEETSKGERSSVFTTSEDMDNLLTKRGSPNAKHANGEAHFTVENHAAKLELPCPASAAHFGPKNQLKPPLHPRPDRGAAATPRTPRPSVSRRLATLAASSGQQSDSSDSQDHRRAWV